MDKAIGRSMDRQIARLAIPALGALLAEPLYVLVDTAIVGHLGRNQLAALGISAAILSTTFGVFNFLAYSTTSAVARAFGAGDHRRALRHGMAGIWLGAAIGLALTAVGFAIAKPVVEVIGGSASVQRDAVLYTRISMLGATFLMVAVATTGYLRGVQDTRTPFAIAIGSNVLNVVLELLFVYGFHWGIAGSAWGTVIAQSAAAIAYLAVMRQHVANAGGNHEPTTRFSFRPDWSEIRSTAVVGSQLMVRTGSLLATFLVASTMAARIGDVQIAAHQIAWQLWLFLALALDAIAIAGQAMIGERLGGNDTTGARTAAARMLRWGWWGGCTAAVAIAVARPGLASIFTDDAAVRDELLRVLWYVALMQPLAAIVFVIDGILIGAGDSAYLAKAMAGAGAVFGIAAVVVAARGADLPSLWVALHDFMFARLIGLALRYRGERWMVLGPRESVKTS